MPLFTRQPPSHQHKSEYSIGVTLGKGGYGEVKLATHIKTGREYALKVVEKKLVKYDVQVRRQTLLMSLDHPHVIKLHSWFESSTKFYILFELARGGELFDHLMDEGRFGEPEAQEIAIALAGALDYLHAKLIVHRDLKLENVLYRTPPGHGGAGHADCVISDFGLGTQLTSEEQKLHSVCGSAGYSAPEVYTQEGYGKEADLWSFGVIVFALMGGRFPYKETEPFALAHEARTTTLFFPATWNSISPLAVDFVKRLLTVDPARRMTAKEAVVHPWLTTDLTTLTSPSPKTADSKHLSSTTTPPPERLPTPADSTKPSSTSASSKTAHDSSIPPPRTDSPQPITPPNEPSTSTSSAKSILPTEEDGENEITPRPTVDRRMTVRDDSILPSQLPTPAPSTNPSTSSSYTPGLSSPPLSGSGERGERGPQRAGSVLKRKETIVLPSLATGVVVEPTTEGRAGGGRELESVASC